MWAGEGGENRKVGGGYGNEVGVEGLVRVGFGRDACGGECGDGVEVGLGEEGKGADGLGGEVQGDGVI